MPAPRASPSVCGSSRGQPRIIRAMQTLTARQEAILRIVVEEYRRTGQPVASKTIAADQALNCRASTVRNELALLEEHGLLAPPHVSAGRVPTDAGQRYVVDRMLACGRGLEPVRRGSPRPRALPLQTRSRGGG